MSAEAIYHICKASAWQEARRTGSYHGSADDRRDGFIHFSSAERVEASAANPVSTVRAAHPLPLGPDRRHRFPALGRG